MCMCFIRRVISNVVNFILAGSDLMATIEEITAEAVRVTETVEAIDLKLDEVKAFILGLQGGQPVTQAQLDELMAIVTGAKSAAAAVLSEADALDE